MSPQNNFAAEGWGRYIPLNLICSGSLSSLTVLGLGLSNIDSEPPVKLRRLWHCQ